MQLLPQTSRQALDARGTRSRQPRWWLGHLVLTAVLTACAAPTPLPPTVPPATATLVVTPTAEPGATIDQFLSVLNQQDQFSGSVLVAQKGQVLLAKGYGQADLDQNLANTPQTKFRIAQLTTPITAMAIMMLQVDGKLDVQDSVCDYVPDCPENWQVVTLHHLLTNSAALADYALEPEFNGLKATPVAVPGALDLVRDQPMFGAPGEGGYYSHTGNYLLGYVIEQVSGQPYAQFLRERIFEPLGMSDTGYNEDLGGLAVGYRHGATVTVAQTADVSWLYAAAGLYSTVEDLYRFDQALCNESLVPQATLDTIFTGHVPIFDSGNAAYGYGWWITKFEDHRVFAHWGSIDGYSTYLGRYVDDGLTVIILSNQDALSAWDQGQLLAQKLFGT
jgi:CubicO group peptidase (beta-lactamase class C family)